MCGIIGYVGKRNCKNHLFKGLKKLEYRGYDSAGVSYFKNKKMVTIKRAGSVENLFENIGDNNFCVGIGHTRWATHGLTRDCNSHPHVSAKGKVSVVHNGIIENYLQIKQKYLSGIEFKSETDTEVVSNLLEYFFLKTKDKLLSIFQCIKILRGSYALAILFDDDDKKIYFAKKKSPLLIGIGDSENYISSDILGFDKDIKSYIDIDDNQFGFIEKNIFVVYSSFQKKVIPKILKINNNSKDSEKNEYPHYMLKEIHEIPNVIEDIINFYVKSFPFLNFDKEYFYEINRIRFISCGTSYHASMIGEKLLSKLGFDTTCEVASEFVYCKHVLNKNTLCIFLSQSGETADTITAIKIAKKYGAKTMGITNVLSSTIAKICDYVLPINCGPEIAVASTKAYNAEIVNLMFFAEYFKAVKTKNIKNLEKNIKKLAKNLKKIAKNIDFEFFERQTNQLVDIVLNAKNVFMIGKNFDYVLALESALKLKEITYINCVAYPSGELKHGTISLVDKNSVVFAFVTEKKLATKTINVVHQVASRGGKIVLVTPFEELFEDELIKQRIILPTEKEFFYPIISIIPMQLLSYKISTALGHNPDKPRNLAKSVTVE